MKKIMFAAMAALAITSCSQNEEFDAQNGNAEISFNTAVTRGTVLVTANFKQFKAYGYAHVADPSFTAATEGTEIMDGTFNLVTPNWTEADNKKFYWPLTEKVAFFGYSLVEGATYQYTSPGYPTVEYTVASDIVAQKDFVVAAVPDQSKAESVALPFKHALTQVVFKLKGEDATVDYSVTKVVLKGIKYKGTYDYGAKTWTIASDAADYTIDLTATPVTFKGEADAIELSANDQLLILMPQVLNGATVEVTYSAKKNEIPLFDSTHKANLVAAWAVGEKNTYTLALKAGDKINVTGALEDTWTSKESDLDVQ